MNGPTCKCGSVTKSRIVNRWPVWECLVCGHIEWLETRIEAMQSRCIECDGRLLLFTKYRTGEQWYQCTACGVGEDLPGREASSA